MSLILCEFNCCYKTYFVYFKQISSILHQFSNPDQLYIFVFWSTGKQLSFFYIFTTILHSLQLWKITYSICLNCCYYPFYFAHPSKCVIAQSWSHFNQRGLWHLCFGLNRTKFSIVFVFFLIEEKKRDCFPNVAW